MSIRTNKNLMCTYWQWQRTVNHNTYQSNPNKNEKIAKELEKMGFREDPAALLSLSDEAKMLLGQAGADKMQNDINEIFQKYLAARIEYGGNDEFAVYGNDQWVVFSKYLYGHGFYDDMSDEDQKNAEHVLMQITDGMDGVAHQLLDSKEARLELESSTAALKYFSDNLLDEAYKADFDALIDKYYTHNSEILNDGYASFEEKFNRAISRLPDAAKERAKRERYKHPDSQAAKVWAVRNILGEITHNTEETKKYSTAISDLFAQMNQENQESILHQVKAALVQFATNDSDNEAVNEYVANHAEDVLSHIHSYWTGVMDINIS